MITTAIPSTWQDLQIQVGRILTECGLFVETEKKIATVRGEVEIDVYAEENVRGRRYVILCECKYWRRAVPQTVIHAFRTVVADTGVHKGYLISKEGFQSGSFSAADLTNVELVTWEQFQEAFEPSWLSGFFSPELFRRLDGLMTYAEPFAPAWFPQLSEEDQQRYMALKEKYDEFGYLVQNLSMHHRLRAKLPFPTLPLVASLGDKFDLKDTPDLVKNTLGYREVLEAALEHGERALAEFRAIRDRAIKNRKQ